VVFVIPFEQDFTLIGTTDVDHADIHDRPKITDDEIAYLCDMASTYFREPITREEIVWTYSAVRPLYDDGSSDAQEATRDYVIEAEVAEGQGLLLNVFGGKITTYRRLAEAALEKIEAALGQRKPAWTARASLPGGDFPIEEYGALLEDCRRAYPFLTAKHLDRLLGLYGTDIHRMLEGKRSIAELGVHFGCGLYETEIQYLEKVEWAKTAEDILFRRTKLGLHLTPAEIEAVELRFANAGQAAKTSTA
jgi:glycerol-3-phosphate dehydrogenase